MPELPGAGSYAGMLYGSAKCNSLRTCMLVLGTAGNRYERSVLVLTSGYSEERIVCTMTVRKSKGHSINVKVFFDALSCFYLMVILVKTILSAEFIHLVICFLFSLVAIFYVNYVQTRNKGKNYHKSSPKTC